MTRIANPLAISNCRHAERISLRINGAKFSASGRRVDSRGAFNVTESRAGARAYARCVSLDYDFHSSAQEKEIRLSPVVVPAQVA